MGRRALAHNELNGVTADVWAEAGVVHKVLTRRARRDVPSHWAPSDDPRHWNYWRREALVYETGLPELLGIGAPRLQSVEMRGDGDVELRLEHLDGSDLMRDDLATAAVMLGRAQATRERPEFEWLSRAFLRAYSEARPVDWSIVGDDRAWDAPLVREHFPPGLRAPLVRLVERRRALVRAMEQLPRAICHLDVWQGNLIRRTDGEIAVIDWAFTGDGAVGEDVGNLILNAAVPRADADELDEALTSAYLRGLRDSGWDGDERVVRLGIRASAVRYAWLVPYCLAHARDNEDDEAAAVRFAGHATALALCARWAEAAAIDL